MAAAHASRALLHAVRAHTAMLHPWGGCRSQLKVSPVKVFVMHIEAVTVDQCVHRISISNMYSQDTLKVRAWRRPAATWVRGSSRGDPEPGR